MARAKGPCEHQDVHVRRVDAERSELEHERAARIGARGRVQQRAAAAERNLAAVVIDDGYERRARADEPVRPARRERRAACGRAGVFGRARTSAQLKFFFVLSRAQSDPVLLFPRNSSRSSTTKGFVQELLAPVAHANNGGRAENRRRRLEGGHVARLVGRVLTAPASAAPSARTAGRRGSARSAMRSMPPTTSASERLMYIVMCVCP